MPKGPAQPLINKQLKPGAQPTPVEETAVSLTTDPKQALTGPLTAEGLEQYQTDALVRGARTLIPGLMRSLRNGLRKNDKTAIQIVAQMYNYAGKSGPTVVTNVQQNFGGGAGARNRQGEESKTVYFESIIRELDVESHKERDDRIIDAEVVEE